MCVCVDGSTSQCVSCCSNSWTPFLVVHPLSLSHRCCCCCCCSSVFFCPCCCCCCCPVEAEICLESTEYLVLHWMQYLSCASNFLLLWLSGRRHIVWSGHTFVLLLLEIYSVSQMKSEFFSWMNNYRVVVPKFECSRTQVVVLQGFVWLVVEESSDMLS